MTRSSPARGGGGTPCGLVKGELPKSEPGVPPGQDLGTSHHHHKTRVATLRAVRFLRSRRRTFL